MATITIDGIEYEVDSKDNLLHVALSLGLDLPYFCWHPAMGSVGACRQCAVKQFKDEADTLGSLVMACMTPAADGARIAIRDPEAVEFRASVIEWLMVNHPHDCPVCDEGGECHLQDMTLMTGHSYRRFRFNKRTYHNQYLGPFVHHEMNRCIQCYRCVRFYRDFAGGRDFNVFGAHDNVYFGRHEDGVLENEFSGNLVEVCPTGVFTDKTLHRHYTRKWDLQTAPSVCTHCGVGCNTFPGERYEQLRRILNRYNREVNGYFLCDRGRFGYEFVNSPLRIREPRLRQEGGAPAETTETVDPELAMESAGAWLREGAGVIGIGSPRASLEANFALQTLVGEGNFYAGMSSVEHHLVGAAIEMLQRGPAYSARLYDIEMADAVLVLGEDLINTAPMLAYAVRQAVRNGPKALPRQLGIPDWNDAAVREAIGGQRGPLFVATPAGTKLDEIATQAYRAAPDDLARLGFAVARALDGGAPEVEGQSEALRSLAEEIAAGLRGAERPVIISGTSLGSLAVMQAAANIAWALSAQGQPAGLSLAVPEANSLGLGLFGGQALKGALEALQSGRADTLIILENDLYRRAEAGFVEALLGAARRVIAIDHLENPTSAKADLALPAATFAEGDGSYVNYEGRAQRFFQVYVTPGWVLESWRWLRDLAEAAGREFPACRNLDEITAALAARRPIFAPVTGLAPPAEFRIADQKVARQPHRYSGRTAIWANRTVHEPEPPEDVDTPFTFTMEGFREFKLPTPEFKRPGIGELVPRYWAPGWNSVQALNKFQSEVAGPLVGGDPGVRLIEPAEGQSRGYFDSIPATFEPRDGEWLVVPLYHIFGSEEQSMHAPGIAELAPAPYLALNPGDLARLEGSESGEPAGAVELAGNPGPAIVQLSIGERAYVLPIQPEASLPEGVAGLPAGLPGLRGAAVALPAWGRLSLHSGEDLAGRSGEDGSG